jgi:uncharacterized protein (TIRG00374 family)
LKRSTNIAFFGFGLAAFGFLMWRFGIDRIAVNIEHAGWSLLYVIIVWFVIYILNTLAWRLALGGHGKEIAFSQLFMVTVSGFVLNYITPVVALGGEPYKVKALGSSMESRQSLSAVVLYRMVHLLGHMLLILTGILAAIVSLPLSVQARVLLALAGALVLALIALIFSGHRGGVFERVRKVVQRFRVLKRFSTAIQKYEADLGAMDEVITGVYRNQRLRFYFSILIEYLSRACMGLEVYLILHGVGVETTVASAMFLYVVYSIIINLLFFIPMNLGAREGGLLLGLESLALPPFLGVYLGLVMRIREFFWILLGLLFILLTQSKREATTSQAL